MTQKQWFVLILATIVSAALALAYVYHGYGFDGMVRMILLIFGLFLAWQLIVALWQYCGILATKR